MRCSTASPTAWRRFDALLSMSPRALALLDDDLHIVEANRALAAMFETSRIGLRGRPLAELVVLDGSAVPPGAGPTPSELDGACGSFVGWGVKDGGRHRVTLWRVAGPEGPVGGAMAMIEAAQDEYHPTSEECEKAQLVQLRRIAAIMAHEVRNPLTGMGGALQVIKERMPRDAADRPVIDEIQKRLYALNAVVDRLQEYATIEHPRLRPVSVFGILARSIEMLHEDGRFGSVRIEVGGLDAIVDGDHDLLVRLFYNLLVNAAQSHGCALVVVTVAAHDRTCSVSVADDGPGIDATERELVFLPFFTTRSQGLGLGLATARRIAAYHGGRVWCAADTERGAEIVVGLPTLS